MRRGGVIFGFGFPLSTMTNPSLVGPKYPGVHMVPYRVVAREARGRPKDWGVGGGGWTCFPIAQFSQTARAAPSCLFFNECALSRIFYLSSSLDLIARSRFPRGHIFMFSSATMYTSIYQSSIPGSLSARGRNRDETRRGSQLSSSEHPMTPGARRDDLVRFGTSETFFYVPRYVLLPTSLTLLYEMVHPLGEPPTYSPR